VKPVVRVGGADRYAVAAGLANLPVPGRSNSNHVVIVCGEDRANADPLAAAGLAGVWKAPVLLSQSASLNKGLANEIKLLRAAHGPLKIHVLGGPVSVSNVVMKRIQALNSGGTIERISGRDRYELSANIAKRAAVEANAQAPGSVWGVMLFNAENPKAFYDALAASSIAGGGHFPMMALQTKKVPSSVNSALNSTFKDVPHVVVSSPTYTSAAIYTKVGGMMRLATSADKNTAGAQIATNARDMGQTWNEVAVCAKLPDALTGGAYMGELGGVMLYTEKASLPTVTKNWLGTAKYATYRGWVFGSNKSVADGTLTQFGTALNTP